MFLACCSLDIKKCNAQWLLKCIEYTSDNEPLEIIEINEINFSGTIINQPAFPLNNGDLLFQDPSSGIIVFLSGFIFNKRDILEQLDLNPNLPDPEFIFHAFHKLHVNFVTLLNGDFAIAIYDAAKNDLFLFRDHLGVRPLAYYHDRESLYFSTHIFDLSRIFCTEKSYNPEPFMRFFRQVDFTQLPSREVHQVLPGHFLRYRNGNVHIDKYWFPEHITENKTMDRTTMLSEMKRLVEKAVKIRCDQRFHAASHVSGGLDCGIVSALARKEYKNQKAFYGLSWSSEKEISEKIDFDERHLVKEHCAINDIIPAFANFSEDDCLRYVSDPVRHSSYFNEQKVLEIAKKNKINLIFSGHGGDEFASKGHRGIDSDLLFKGQWAAFFRKNPINKPKTILYRLLFEVLFPAIKIMPPSINKSHKTAVRYLKKGFEKFHKKTIQNFYFYSSRRQLHLGFFYCYYLNERMAEWYVRGQQEGVEYRYPLLDKDIVEFVLSIPSKLLFKDHYARSILREISEGLLPESVRWKESGRDPSIEYLLEKVYINCGKKLIHELPAFRENMALSFFDFDLFEKDYESFSAKKKTKELESIYNHAVILKILDGETKSYLTSQMDEPGT